MANSGQGLVEGLAKGTTSAVLEFFASRWRILMLFHWSWTIKKYKEDGTYPAMMAVELTKTPVITERNTLLVRFQIHLTPRIRYHLEKFVICKQGNLSEVQNYIFGGVNNEFPQLHVGELGVPIETVNLPYNRSPKVIDKIIDRVYLCSEATFEIPYKGNKEKMSIRIIAKTHDKDKSYKLYSEWIEL